MGTSGDEQCILAEMSGIENQDDIHCFVWFRVCYLVCVNCLPNKILTHTIRGHEVFDGLSFPDMINPDILPYGLRPSFVLKLLATITTLIMLYFSSRSVLLYPGITAIRTLFLDMVCSF